MKGNWCQRMWCEDDFIASVSSGLLCPGRADLRWGGNAQCHPAATNKSNDTNARLNIENLTATSGLLLRKSTFLTIVKSLRTKDSSSDSDSTTVDAVRQLKKIVLFSSSPLGTLLLLLLHAFKISFTHEMKCLTTKEYPIDPANLTLMLSQFRHWIIRQIKRKNRISSLRWNMVDGPNKKERMTQLRPVTFLKLCYSL